MFCALGPLRFINGCLWLSAPLEARPHGPGTMAAGEPGGVGPPLLGLSPSIHSRSSLLGLGETCFQVSYVSGQLKTELSPSLRGEEKLNPLASLFPSPPSSSADLPGVHGHDGPPQGVCGSAGSWSLWSVLGLLAILPESSCAVVAFRCSLGWPLCSRRDCSGPSCSWLCATLPPPRHLWV